MRKAERPQHSDVLSIHSLPEIPVLFRVNFGSQSLKGDPGLRHRRAGG